MKGKFILKKLIVKFFVIATVLVVVSGCTTVDYTQAAGFDIPLEAFSLIRETNAELKQLVGDGGVSKYITSSATVDYATEDTEYPFIYYFENYDGMFDDFDANVIEGEHHVDGNIWADDAKIVMVEAYGAEQCAKLYGSDVLISYELMKQAYPTQPMELELLSKDARYTLYEFDVWVTNLRHEHYTMSATFNLVDGEYMLLTSAFYIR